MAEAGVDERHIALVLGHSDRLAPRVTGIYNRYRYAAEKRAALLVLEARLLAILNQPGLFKAKLE